MGYLSFVIFLTHGKVKISFKIMGLVLCLDKENKTTEI